MPPRRQLELNHQRRAKRHQKQREICLLYAAFVSTMTTHLACSLLFKTPKHTGKRRGQDWVNELTAIDAHPSRIKAAFGVSGLIFKRLLAILGEFAGLCHSRWVSAEEQLAIFLFMTVNASSNRQAQEQFQRSGETISK